MKTKNQNIEANFKKDFDKKMSAAKNIEMAQELKNEVSKWVETFNYLDIEVLKAVAERNGQELFEVIEQAEITLDDVAEWRGCDVSEIEEESAEDCNEYDEMREQKEQENYPMWNTCFEFKQEASEGEKEAARAAGFGIIEGLGNFNTILFVSGCGYSFYGAHWIPMYLALPYNEAERTKYAGVEYGMM